MISHSNSFFVRRTYNLNVCSNTRQETRALPVRCTVNYGVSERHFRVKCPGCYWRRHVQRPSSSISRLFKKKTGANIICTCAPPKTREHNMGQRRVAHPTCGTRSFEGHRAGVLFNRTTLKYIAFRTGSFTRRVRRPHWSTTSSRRNTCMLKTCAILSFPSATYVQTRRCVSLPPRRRSNGQRVLQRHRKAAL